jgi:hypothetical protein
VPSEKDTYELAIGGLISTFGRAYVEFAEEFVPFVSETPEWDIGGYYSSLQKEDVELFWISVPPA